MDRHGLVDAGHRVLVAVSGGLDSVVLLDLLARIAPRRGWELVVAHFDHGVRRDSAEDARWVADHAARLGLSLRLGRAAESSVDPGGSPEERLRSMRLAFLEDAASAEAADRIALGHHRDDRSEWLVLRLLQGVPPDGWSLAARNGIQVRPLHGLGRARLRAYADARGLDWREDASNGDLGIPRNRVRHAILPELERLWGRPVDEALAHVADAAERDRAYFEGAVQRLLDEAREGRGLRVDLLRSAHPALRERALGSWLVELGGEARRGQVRALEALLGAAPEAGVDLGGGLRVVRRLGRLLPRPVD